MRARSLTAALTTLALLASGCAGTAVYDVDSIPRGELPGASMSFVGTGYLTILLLIVVVVSASVRIMQEYQRLVVFTLGPQESPHFDLTLG
jgi:hypothetical protein